MDDYKEMREGKILLNRFPYNECKDFRRQSQHEKENLYFLTNEDGFFMKMYEAVGNPKLDEVWIEKYYPESKVTARKCIHAKKQYEDCEVLEFDTLFENIENVPYLNLKNPVDFLVNRNGCLCIQHVSNSGVMEELRLNCYSEKVTNYLLKEAKLLRSSLDQEVNNYHLYNYAFQTDCEIKIPLKGKHLTTQSVVKELSEITCPKCLKTLERNKYD